MLGSEVWSRSLTWTPPRWWTSSSASRARSSRWADAAGDDQHVDVETVAVGELDLLDGSFTVDFFGSFVEMDADAQLFDFLDKDFGARIVDLSGHGGAS